MTKSINTRILENLTTKSGTIAQKFQPVIDMLLNPERPAHPKAWTGTGSRKSLSDHSANLELGLRLIGVEFETGNDAPRGGVAGYYVRLTPAGIAEAKKFIASKQVSSNWAGGIYHSTTKWQRSSRYEITVFIDRKRNGDTTLTEFSNGANPRTVNMGRTVSMHHAQLRYETKFKH